MKEIMTAALKTNEGTFEVKEVERVKIPAEDWVLARVRVSGICGTDLRHWKKHEPDLECKIMGHEMAGESGFEKGNTPLALDWQKLQMGQIQLVFSASYAFWDIYPEMKMCLDLLSKGKLNAKKMITHSFPLNQINEAFDTAQRKDETGALFVALKH